MKKNLKSPDQDSTSAKSIGRWLGIRNNGLAIGSLILAVGMSALLYTNCSGYHSNSSGEKLIGPSELLSPSDLSGGDSFFAQSGDIIGNIERLVDNGSTLELSGWACKVGSPAAIDLNIGVEGGGALGYTTANIVRESAVKEVCQSTSYNHGFSFTISEQARNANDGRYPTVRSGSTFLPKGSELGTISRVPSQPIPPTNQGFFDSMTYRTDGTGLAEGWACVTGSDEIVSLQFSLDGYVRSPLGTHQANLFRGFAVQNACNSPSPNHGFRITIAKELLNGLRRDYPNSKLEIIAQSSVGQKALTGSFVLKPLDGNPLSYPYTISTRTWQGPGGSTWDHKLTVKDFNSATGNLYVTVYSSSRNDKLTPSFLETRVDKTLTIGTSANQINSCSEVGIESRKSRTSGDQYVVRVRACIGWIELFGVKYPKISFSHIAENITRGLLESNGKASYSGDHGSLVIALIVN